LLFWPSFANHLGEMASQGSKDAFFCLDHFKRKNK